MPFQGSRGPLFLGLIVIFVIIIGAAVAASMSAPRKTNIPGTVVMTVKGETGISLVEITNQNTDQTILLEKSDLPFNFNCTAGDELLIKVSTLPNYYFNSWRFNTNVYGSFDHHNPLYLSVSSPVTMTATVLYIQPSPTLTPTPAPSVIE